MKRHHRTYFVDSMPAFGGLAFDFAACGIDYLVSSANKCIEGVAAREARYRRNHRVLVDGMRALGFRTYLPDALQSPIITTFLPPAGEDFDFNWFYDQVEERGYVIYSGKVLHELTFRIATIGRIFETDVRNLLDAIRDVMAER